MHYSVLLPLEACGRLIDGQSLEHGAQSCSKFRADVRASARA